VTVTDIAPLPGAGDTEPTNEFVVAGSLRVNDYLYLIPFPAVGANYATLTGVLTCATATRSSSCAGPTTSSPAAT